MGAVRESVEPLFEHGETAFFQAMIGELGLLREADHPAIASADWRGGVSRLEAADTFFLLFLLGGSYYFNQWGQYRARPFCHGSAW
jgi:hypothetical protein